jgi:hypothetical protein
MSELFSEISYPLICRVLVKQLGFEMQKVSGSYIFSHPETNTLLALPILPHQKNLTLTHYRMIHEVLDKSGVMAGKVFKALLDKELIKGSSDNKPTMPLALTD